MYTKYWKKTSNELFYTKEVYNELIKNNNWLIQKKYYLNIRLKKFKKIFFDNKYVLKEINKINTNNLKISFDEYKKIIYQINKIISWYNIKIHYENSKIHKKEEQ